MPFDHIRYDILVQEALRGMVHDVLAEAAKNKSMPGDHHFYITFDTTAEDARLSDRLRAQYPEEMTIVLQHQFWDLKVSDEAFEVGLSFGGVAERLYVPFEAIKQFSDPSVQFTLQFETLTDAPDNDAETEPSKAEQLKGKRKTPSQKIDRTGVPPSALPAPAAAESEPQDKDKPGEKGGAEVVRLDRFRKK